MTASERMRADVRPERVTATAAALVDAPPPPTDRGVEVTVKTDFLTCTTRKTPDDISAVICKYTGAGLQELSYGFNGYHRQLVGLNGLRVGFTPGRDDASVNIPGEACTQLGTYNLVGLVDELAATPTRVDVAFDHCPFTPRMLDRAWRDGNVNTRVRREGDSYVSMCNADGNTTLYMGSKSSDTRLVAYDRRGHTRLELRLRRDRAAFFWAKLVAQGPESLPSLGLGVITAHADFVQRARADSNPSRAPRLRWWAKFALDVAKVRLTQPDLEPTVERAERHIQRQAAMLETYLQIREKKGVPRGKSLEKLLDVGVERMRDRHLALVAMVPDYLLGQALAPQTRMSVSMSRG